MPSPRGLDGLTAVADGQVMDTDDAGLAVLARQVAAALAGGEPRLVTAESCTGGWIAKLLTDIPGSSTWFTGGLVSYSNASKTALLGVPADLIQARGAVSGPVVEAMATGARAAAGADYALAVSGIAGPGGGSPEKPVGTVWLAWAGPGTAVRSIECHFGGDRDAVRRQAVAAAFTGLLELIAAE